MTSIKPNHRFLHQETIHDCVMNVKDNVRNILKKADVYLVFDRYKPYSTKIVTRSGRTTQASRIHQLILEMQLLAQKAVRTVTENKQQLTKLICSELTQNA